MSQLLKSVLGKNQMPPPPVPGNINHSDFAPGNWQDYFETRRLVPISDTEKKLAATVECRVVAYDCRSHGSTSTGNDEDLSASTLATDCIRLATALFPDAPPLILVGHSLGGAIVVHAAMKGLPGLVGLVVVDVVEGTALDALPAMTSILKRRPKSFTSIEEAIAWTLRSGTVHNREAAAISVPSQFVPSADGVIWRTDLLKSQAFWEGWFQDLSKNFLSVPVNKMLLLAGTDRLDKELTIAQMMGKFALKMLPLVGHVIQEDVPTVALILQDPKGTADTLVDYLTRNRWTSTK